MIVYLIHFSQPLGHARHYIGTTRVYASRMRAHKAGRGASILRACNERGVNWRVVRKWYGSRKKEKQLKARKDSASLCPVCSRRRRAYRKRWTRARAKDVASQGERMIIKTTACPKCKARAGQQCTIIRNRPGDPTANRKLTSLHPGRKALYEINLKANS